MMDSLEWGVPSQDKYTLVMKSAIAGLQFHVDEEQDEKVMQGLRPGMRLKMTREPENRFDPWAIKLSTMRGDMVGYFSRYKNEMLARMMDAGTQFIAVMDKAPEDEEKARRERRYAPTENVKYQFSVYMRKPDEVKDIDVEFEPNPKVKECLEQLTDACYRFRKSNLSTTAKKDLINLLLALSCSDGKITWQEAEFIAIHLGRMFTPQQMRARVREHNLYSAEFFRRMPDTMVESIELMDLSSPESVDNWQNLIEAFYEAADVLSAEFIACDREATPKEEADRQRYLQMIINHLKGPDKKKAEPVDVSDITHDGPRKFVKQRKTDEPVGDENDEKRKFNKRRG